MSRESLNVLVTALGGDLGQAIVKALRLSERPVRLHGCDLDPRGVGAAFVRDYRAVSPAAESDLYLRDLEALCREWQIQVVIPASEPEIRLLSQIQSFPRLTSGAVVVCQGVDWLNAFGDKLHCMRALAAQIPLVPFADGADSAGVAAMVRHTGFPVVVKPRVKSGSRGVRIVQDEPALWEALRQTDAPLVQQYIEADEGEFSVGLFAGPAHAPVIAFRRDLGPIGATWYAENSTDFDVLDYSRRVIEVSGLSGSANLQVRKTRGRVQLLEINPRFSSLVAARALCGFRDVEWSIALALGEPVPAPAADFGRLRFRRFFHEVVDLGDGFAALHEWLPPRTLPAPKTSSPAHD